MYRLQSDYEEMIGWRDLISYLVPILLSSSSIIVYQVFIWNFRYFHTLSGLLSGMVYGLVWSLVCSNIQSYVRLHLKALTKCYNNEYMRENYIISCLMYDKQAADTP